MLHSTQQPLWSDVQQENTPQTPWNTSAFPQKYELEQSALFSVFKCSLSRVYKALLNFTRCVARKMSAALFICSVAWKKNAVTAEAWTLIPKLAFNKLECSDPTRNKCFPFSTIIFVQACALHCFASHQRRHWLCVNPESGERVCMLQMRTIAHVFSIWLPTLFLRDSDECVSVCVCVL